MPVCEACDLLLYVSWPWHRSLDRPQGEAINAYASADGPGIYSPGGSYGPQGPYSPPAVPGPSFGVNLADLDAAATLAQNVGQAMPGELQHIYQPSDDAVAGLAGWRTAASLKACSAAWEECLRKLGTEVDGISTKFSSTATNYRNADHSGANGLNGVGTGPNFPKVS